MIFDSTSLFSSAQAITASAASSNVIDLGQPGTVFGAATPLARDIGKGAEVPIGLRVVESFNNLTSLTVTVETDDNAGFTSPTAVFTSIAYPLADLASGARHLLPDEIPVGVKNGANILAGIPGAMDTSLKGGTPTSAGMNAALMHLKTLPADVPRAVLLPCC